MADLRIVISALNKASGDLNKLKTEISGVKGSAKDATAATGGLGGSLSSMMGTAALAVGAVVAVGAAMKQVYDTAKEGAALEYAETRFDNLAKSIGTTADVLLTDMREATSGMMSDAELVASGADFMALGLAKSHDEVVRLSSVAGQLGMNMNQLVLTLTNKTTMRFDALGVSVDGFNEKVKALEAAGLSADNAFKEAFLQQAEAQILKVGSAADSSIGAFQRMEAAQANYFNALKKDLAEAGTWLAEFWAGVYNEKIEARAYNALMEQAHALGINTDALDAAVRGSDAYGRVTSDGIEQNKAAVEALGEQVRAQAEMNEMRSRGTNANYTYAASQKLVTDEAVKIRSEFQLQADSLTTLDSTYKGIIDLGYKYTDAMAEINAKQAEYDAMPGWKKASKDGKELLSDIEALKASMAEMADRVTLDMFQATIAIGGVTEAELTAYMQMAIDMGYMSEEGAKAAMEAYGNAISTINGYEIDEKTGNITFDAQQAFEVITMINAMEIADKNGNIDIFVRYHGTTPNSYDPYENYTGNAVGGAVYGGNPYTWQEYGYRGELFIPSQDGYVLSRAEAERALSRALVDGKSGGGSDAQSIASAVAGAITGAMSTKQAQPAYTGPSAQDIARAVRDGLLMSRAL